MSQAAAPTIQLRRAHEAPAAGDGVRMTRSEHRNNGEQETA